MRYPHPHIFALLVPYLLLPTCIALWPFKQNRFVAEALIDAGSLGLKDVSGRVVAVGDWDGNQKLDLFTLSQDRKTIQVHLWDKNHFTYRPSSTLTLSSPILNAVPGDYNHDGKLDLLVMYEEGEKGGWWNDNKAEKTGMQVYLGGGDNGGFQKIPWEVPSSTPAQPIVFDADGSLRPSLLGYHPSTSGSSSIRAWQNDGTGFTIQAARLDPADQVCQLVDPHSSAFVDIDGDCLPDLVLHCERPKTTHRFIQIWLNRGTAGFVLARTYDLPNGSGPLSFADMNRDGTLDMIFPTCDRQSSSAGTGSECSINIAYNRQIPICPGITSEQTSSASTELKCRGWGELCVPDEKFELSFEEGSEIFKTIPFSSLFPGKSPPDLLLHAPDNEWIPLPIRPGDYNVDGFPDLLLTISNDTAKSSGGIFGSSRGTQIRILQNVPCGKGVAGCDGKSGRGLQVGGGKGWEVLDQMNDVVGASWMDVDDDGSLDILVQRSGDQDGSKVSFIQNNFYHDAFFLKAQVLNGACDGDCEPIAGGKKYSPLGVSYSGATFKFTVLDTAGRRVAQQAAQLPQTGYHALETPYSFIGLGRTNNYVERLFVGASLYAPFTTTDLESLVPNSQVLISPPFPAAMANPDDPTDGPVKSRSNEWRSELFLHPGDWVPWVGAAVICTVLVLGMTVVGLNEKEKREDEKERQRALHAINFQAL